MSRTTSGSKREDASFISRFAWIPRIRTRRSRTSFAVCEQAGRRWFASGPAWPGPVPYGVAVWDRDAFVTYDPVIDIGMAEQSVQDLIALPDGRILLAGPNTRLVIWNPSTGVSLSLRAPDWLADDRVRRIELDRMVSPPALHVSTSTGATVIRVLP